MKYKKIITSTNKEIHIYDDLYSFETRYGWYNFIKESHFFTTSYDLPTLETKGDYNMYSYYNNNDLEGFGFLEHENTKQISHHYEGLEIATARVNLATLGDKNRFHVDFECLSVLYYPNLKWDIEWGGFTLFADDQVQNIEYTSIYTPGRVIVFDGSIPHFASAPVSMAPSYRFSFNIKFKKWFKGG